MTEKNAYYDLPMELHGEPFINMMVSIIGVIILVALIVGAVILSVREDKKK